MYQQKLEKQLQISLLAGILYKVSNRSLDPFLQTSVSRKSSRQTEAIINLSLYYLIHRKSLKWVYINKILLFLIKYFKNFNAVLGKKWCSTCLIALLERWSAGVDQGLEFGAVLTDLSKAFHCLPHSLLLAKCFDMDLI